jgi:hypothetical protein
VDTLVTLNCEHKDRPYWSRGLCRACYEREWKRKEKLAVFDAYGGPICQCCGETTFDFLSLDHASGGGYQDRKLRKSTGLRFYQALKKADYPPGLRVLCYNCNMGRHIHGGICPHKDPKEQDAAQRVEEIRSLEEHHA